MSFNVAIIGCGAIAKRAHIPIIKKMISNKLNLVAVCDINPKRAKSIARNFSIRNHYSNINEMLKKEKIDIAVIATPHFTHAEIARKCAENGINLIIEKPLSNNLKGALAIMDIVRSNNVKATIVQNYRFFKSLNQVKALLERGELGRITQIYASAHNPFPNSWTRSTWPYEDEKGVLIDLFPHVVDTILWLLNFPTIEEVFAVGDTLLNNKEFITYSSALVEFNGGIYSFFETSWLNGLMDMTVIIRGTAGRILLDIRNDFYTVLRGFVTPLDELIPAIKKASRLAVEIVKGIYFTKPLLSIKFIYDRMIDSLLKGTREPIPIEEGVLVIGLIEAIHESIKKKTLVRLDELFEKFGYNYKNIVLRYISSTK
mgnify:CR=1 FL=1